jgi:signal transduction histidine kinase/DNA-binding response OmpR family regulator/ligand-binding sensor domain-containing protein
MPLCSRHCFRSGTVVLLLLLLTWTGTAGDPSETSEQQLSLSRPDVAVTFERFWVVTSPLRAHRRQDGMLWVVTPSGLYRHDGYELRYFHEPWEKPEARMASYFSCGAEDENGNLWVGAMYGFQRFDDRTGSFERYTTDPDQPTTISSNSILSLCPDGKGNVWVGTLHGLNRFDRAARIFRRFVHVPGDMTSLLCDTVFHLNVRVDGCIWTGSHRGLSMYDPATDRFTSYTTETPLPFRLPSNEIRCLYPGKDGTLWFATGRGIAAFDFKRGTSRHYPVRPHEPSALQDTMVTCMTEDGLGNLWLGTWSHGLVRLERETGRFIYYLQEEAASSLSPGGSRRNVPVNQLRSVRSITPDRNNVAGTPAGACVLWVTGDGAVWRVTVAPQHFAEVTPKSIELADGQVLRSVVPLENRYFWTTRLRGNARCIDLKSLRMREFPVTGRAGRDMLVSGAAMTPDGTTWLVISSRLYRLDVHKKSIDQVPGVENVGLLCRGRDGGLWLSAMKPGTIIPHLAYFDPGTGLITRYERDKLPGEGTYGAGTISLLEDRNGEIWFGTFGRGLFRFNPQSRLYRRYSSAPGNTGALKMDVIRALLMDSTGTIWIGTDSGLHRYIRESDTFERFEATGQESNDQGHFIRGLALDQKGDIWLTHATGITRFDHIQRRFRDFTEVDGLRRTQYVKPVFEPVSHMMYATDLTGSVVAFRPEELSSDLPCGKVLLTDFRVFENSVLLPDPIHRTRQVYLTYDQNFFSFRFSALEYVRIDKIHYAYKMEGFDRDWVQAGTRSYAGYTNLDHGTYLFQVKATDTDGVWSDSVTTISVIIQPPWWQTPWAYSLFAFTAVALLFGVWQYDRRRVRLRHELEMKGFEARKLLEVDQLKTRFFANISHECRTPLTLILGPAEKLSSHTSDADDRRDLETIQHNARNLLNLINQLLDLSKLDAGHMVLQVCSTDLVLLLQRIVASFSSLADRKKINLYFHPHDQSLVAFIDQEKCERIVDNLLSNAFKFTGPGGDIVVRLRRREKDAGPAAPEGVYKTGAGWAEISVSDTGMGIPQPNLTTIFDRFYQVDGSSTRTHSGTGIGLSLTKELVELHRGYITVTSKEGEGSTFVVGFPLGREEFTPDEIVEPSSTITAPVESVRGPTAGDGPDVPDEGARTEDGASSAPLVLLIEDNADLRRYIREFMQEDFRVLEAVDGIEGMESAFSAIPDLVVSDIMMPRMDGVELCRRLKNDERTSHIPVVLLTARASGESKLEGLETGADDYIIKPFDAKELLARAHNLIEIRRALRKKFRERLVLEPADFPLSSADARFLKKLMDAIEHHMADTGCNTETLAQELCLSRMQLNRKLHALTGQSTHEFLKLQRLKRAEQLLRHHHGNISEICYEVGFASPSHFAQAFKEQFGISPSEYLETHREIPGHD